MGGLLMAWLGRIFWVLTWLTMPLVVAAQDVAGRTAAQADFHFIDPYFETVGDMDSLGDSVITSLLQDHKGLLWIGTSKGLIQYDGYRFRRYTHHPRDPHSLAGEYIISLCFDNAGRLWIGTNSNGLSMFDPDTERFRNFRHDPANPGSLSQGRIWALAAAHDGGVWIATDKGLDYLPQDGNVVRHYRPAPGNPTALQEAHVRSLLLDRAGNLWIGTASGLQFLPKGGQAFAQIAAQALAGREVRSLLQSADGQLWLGTRKHGAARYDIRSKSLHWLPVDVARADALSHPWIKTMAQTPDGNLWLGTVGGGLNIVRASDAQVIKRLRRDPAIASSLAVDDLGALLLDQAGLLWIGTWGGGLQRHHVANSAIRMMRHSPSQPHSLSKSEVRSMLELANGQILLAAYGNGIDLLDRQRGMIGGYRPPPLGRLPDANILTLTQTPDGAIWAGSQQNGVMRLLPGEREWQLFGVEQGLPGLQIRSFLVTKKGDLWVGTTLGAARWLAKEKKFVSLPAANGRAIVDAVEVMVEDQQGRVWLGSGGGLWLWQGGNKLDLIRHEVARSNSLPSDDVRGLLIDHKGILWVGSPQGLSWLAHFKEGYAEFEHVSNHLAQNLDVGENLLQDKSGRIWSNNFVYDTQHRRVYPLTKADGFDIGTAWMAAFASTRDGLFMYGGTQGLAIIDPQRFFPWNYQPPVVISELKINGKHKLLGKSAAELVLNPQRRNFSLEFAALDYSSPNKLRYSYRLQGYERDWIETDASHRVASYGNLWPGNYVLQVRATNRLGEYSKRQLEIPVKVLPAFWQTGWFVVCVLLLSSGLVYGGYSWRVARMRANARQLQAMVDARTADILHLAEIGQDLTATLDTEQAFARVYQQVRTRMDAHVFSIGLVNEDRSELVFVYDMENGQRLPVTTNFFTEQDRPAIWCVREQRELITGSSQDLLHYVDSILPPSIGELMETVVYLPLIVEQQVLGCLTVQSPKAHAYNQDHLEFLRVLASYAAIALANSAAHSKLGAAHAELAAALGHLKETQARLIHSEKMASLGGLVAGIAHEVNTPLGTTLMAISGATQALESLQRGFAVGKVNRQQMEACVRECMDYAALAFKTASRAASLVTTFKSIAVSSQDDDISQLELSSYLQELMRAMYRPLQPPGCEYRLELPPILMVKLVPGYLLEVLTRLFDNVIVHAFANGRQGILCLRAQVDGEYVVLEVADNGHGIAAQHLPRVFDPFFTTRGGDQGHVGLGLHVAYNHVTQGLRGEISLTSTEGVGTCVTLRFLRNHPAALD